MSDLDKLLKEYASRPTPPPPSNLEDGVWREIRRRRERRFGDSFFEWLAAHVWGARAVSACVLSAIISGIGFALVDLGGSAGRPAFHALNLQVFSEHSPTLPLSSLYE
jgi:hypothetical protein